jgi:hypothetical protein
VAQGVVLKFKPQYRKNNNNNNKKPHSWNPAGNGGKLGRIGF